MIYVQVRHHHNSELLVLFEPSFLFFLRIFSQDQLAVGYYQERIGTVVFFFFDTDQIALEKWIASGENLWIGGKSSIVWIYSSS